MTPYEFGYFVGVPSGNEKAAVNLFGTLANTLGSTGRSMMRSGARTLAQSGPRAMGPAAAANSARQLGRSTLMQPWKMLPNAPMAEVRRGAVFGTMQDMAGRGLSGAGNFINRFAR